MSSEYCLDPNNTGAALLLGSSNSDLATKIANLNLGSQRTRTVSVSELGPILRDKQTIEHVENITAELLTRNITEMGYPKVKMWVRQSVEFNVNELFTIVPKGYQRSRRAASDGVVFFGTQKSQWKNKFNISSCDIIARETPDSSFGKIQFIVYFSPKHNQYFILDQMQGSGTFALLNQPLVVQPGQIVSFGASHVTFDYSHESGDQSLIIVFASGPMQSKVFQFQPGFQRKITIGRHKSCDLVIQDNGLSRVQLTIFWDNANWILKDCDGIKQSTNGTWIFLKDPFPLLNDLSIKAGKTVIKCEIINP